MVEGLLFDSRIAKCKGTKLFDSYQLALPEVAIKTIIRLYYDSPLGGHGGIQHTADMLKEHCYFPKFLQIVTNYVRGCTSEQTEKPAMMERANEQVQNLTLKVVDFVYMCKDPTGPGHKSKYTFEGPYVVDKCEKLAKKPVRFRNNDFTTPESSVDSRMSETVKIKHLLACKIVNGTHKYLVHLSCEPAQNARWMDISDLDIKSKQLVKKRPPPLIE
ncbi:unnamed protein product [Mytilus coruscus]|uniref:Integrase zinc-binding domain-containing protein n=1 Tax=Mytilus coruscus TaxID=42192 RepID=A0A6J8EKK8_MYTCO|nr:unnamed protein product [Mytilus coruscus]